MTLRDARWMARTQHIIALLPSPPWARHRPYRSCWVDAIVAASGDWLLPVLPLTDTIDATDGALADRDHFLLGNKADDFGNAIGAVLCHTIEAMR